MSVEERFLEAVEEIEDVEIGPVDPYERRHQWLQRKNKSIIDRFLGRGKRVYEVAIVPRYYGELLAWALKRYLEKEGWKVTRILGYHAREPVYIDVNTDYKEQENMLRDGQLLVQRGEVRLIVSVDINLQWRNSVLVEGPLERREEVSTFSNGVMRLAREQNFYRGKKIEFAGRLRFLNLEGRSWDSITLDSGLKQEIRSNTIEFLKKRELWSKLGIPLKRGVLLAGEPGTGKSIICKALMAEAEGITCLTTNAYALSEDGYITELYELAEDLAPCLIFVEDIDLIGQNREEFGYQTGPALLSLLAIMDGIEERKEIVTVATTNCLEKLDKALAERPARFDRVIKLVRPGLEERKELIKRICTRIPLDESAQEHIALRSEGCTPAQLQEIIFSLAIEHAEVVTPEKPLSISTDTIDRVMSRINGKSKPGLGFKLCNNGKTH